MVRRPNPKQDVAKPKSQAMESGPCAWNPPKKNTLGCPRKLGSMVSKQMCLKPQHTPLLHLTSWDIQEILAFLTEPVLEEGNSKHLETCQLWLSPPGVKVRPTRGDGASWQETTETRTISGWRGKTGCCLLEKCLSPSWLQEKSSRSFFVMPKIPVPVGQKMGNSNAIIISICYLSQSSWAAM